MGTRTISAQILSASTCYDEGSANFTSSLYSDPAVYNATCLGGEITFSRFRGISTGGYYFNIYIGGVKACETREILDASQSTHELITYIDTNYGFHPDVLLQASGAIEVEVISNTSSNGQICSFRENCVITIKASYNDPSVSISAPTVSQNNNGQYVVSWSEASWENGTGSVTYSLYYGTNNTLAYSGTSQSTTITIPSNYYGVSIPFTVVAEYSGITDYATTYFTANYPSISTPANLKINGNSSYTGQNISLTWSASTLSYITGTITYGILVNGSQFATTTETSYTISEEIAKGQGTATIAIVATCGNYESDNSSSVSFTYEAGHTYINYYTDGQWVQCIVHYYSDGQWHECIPHYYTQGAWIECSSKE